MPRCLVSLGSNLGETRAALEAAVHGLRQLAEHESLQVSNFHTTAPIGGPGGQEGFLNAVASFEVSVDPAELLVELQQIELAHDRCRGVRWAARTLDLDLLLYDEDVLSTPSLRIPHPRMTFRPFVLVPACEIAADWRHPECDRELGALLPLLQRGDDAVAIRHDPEGEVEACVRRTRPELLVETSLQAAPPRLTIDARPDPRPLPPCGPRLVLADCPREHWRNEVVAALECVWPASP